jgi:hypothetical protein
MAKFELSLTPDYVPGWTIVDAIREIVQNAVDQETKDPDNRMYHKYEVGTQTLYIGSRNSSLERRTLLLGSSTKTDDKATVGQFGEGYKIAALVLTRLGKKLTIRNHAKKEEWYCRFVKSTRYGADVLTFFIETGAFWTKMLDSNLVFSIQGITPEEWEEVASSNLHFQPKGEFAESHKGSVLFDPKFKGNIYVNGLYVTHYEKYAYGYDFKPGELDLDRDRKLVSDFALSWLASNVWAGLSTELAYANIIAQLLKEEAPDVLYVPNQRHITDAQVPEISFEQFTQEHGENAHPVTTTQELADLPPEVKPVIVSPTYAIVLKSSKKYKEPEMIVRRPLQAFEDWLANHGHLLTEEAQNDLAVVIKEVYDNGQRDSSNIPF